MLVLDEIAVFQKMPTIKGLEHVENRCARDVLSVQKLQHFSAGVRGESLLGRSLQSFEPHPRLFRLDRFNVRVRVEPRISKPKSRVHPSLLTQVETTDRHIPVSGSKNPVVNVGHEVATSEGR